MKLRANKKLKDPVNAFQLSPVLEDIDRLFQTLPIYSGNGDPESVVAAKIGSLFLRLDGGTSATLYVKESDDGGVTGWVAK